MVDYRQCVGLYVFVCLRLWNLACGQIVYSIAEETNPGTTVGNLAKDLNLNVADLALRQFQIVSGPYERYFEMNLKTGHLVIGERLDREELCGRGAKCSLELEAIVRSPMTMYRFEINVLDINDNAPTFRSPLTEVNISESAFPGERFSLPSAYDADVGMNSVKSYRLSSSEYFTLETHGRGEHASAPELVLQKPLDREKQTVLKFKLIAADGGKPPKSGTLDVIVNIEDVNDNIPVFSMPLYKGRVTENAPVGTSVITVHAVDADEGLNGAIFYSIVNQDDEHMNAFDIDTESGVIVVKGVIDYEVNSALEIRVQAKDKGHKPRAAYCKVLIEIIDINDNVPEISVTSLVSSVKEDTVVGTMVGLITVKDGDGGSNGVVHLKIQGSVPFRTQNTYKNKYSLLVDGKLDRENISAYNITILASDDGSPPLTSTSVISVRVSDVNDNAPVFPEPIVNIFVRENSEVGHVIHTVSAFDKDEGVNAKVSYSLLSGPPSGGLVTSLVSINPENGDIHTMQSYNYEENKMFQFSVKATDSGVPALSSNVTVNVYIVDENDNSPMALPPYSDHGTVNSENIPYTAEAGYFVAKIRALDADAGYNALLSYHLTEPKGNTLFRIGTSNGEIRTKRRMSDNDLKTHPLIVFISDSGEPALSATVSIEVVVVESAGDLQTKYRHTPAQEDAFSDLNMYLIVAIAAVSLVFLLSLISLIAVRCHRTDTDFSGYNPPMITTHPDGTWSYSKSTQQYDVCFSSDTLKSDVVVFPTPFPPADAELISINGADSLNRTQTLPSRDKVRAPR